MRINITNGIYLDFLNCKYKANLKMNGLKGEKSEYEKIETRFASKYRENVIHHMGEKYCKKTVGSHIPFTDLLESGLDIAYDINIKGKDYFVSCDAIFVVSLSGPQLIPVLFIHRENVKIFDKMSLAFSALFIERKIGHVLPYGRIIYGNQFKNVRVNLAPHRQSVLNNIEELHETRDRKKIQKLYLNKHCGVCEFQTICRTKAVQDNDLSLITCLKPKQIKRLNKKGIFTVTQYSYTFRPRKRRLKEYSNPLQPALKALSIRKNKTHICNIPELPNTKTSIYIDIESLPDDNFVYLIGLVIVHRGIASSYSFWADDKTGQSKIFNKLLSTISDYSDYTIYHYGNYDKAFLKRMLKVSNDTDGERDNILKNCFNLLTCFGSDVYPPTYSNGLKEICNYLGYSWSDKSSSGIQSIVWRRKWELSKNLKYKDKILLYNYEDCLALKFLRNWLCTLEEQIDNAEQQKVILRTKDITRENIKKWGNANFQLNDYKKINDFAYFDYQRSRIYLRTDKNVKKAIKRKEKRGKRINNIDTVVDLQPKSCPNCGSTDLVEKRASQKTIIDLKFLKSGVKKWIVKYKGGVYICKHCCSKIVPKNFQRIPVYEKNLVAWTINLHIKYRIPLEGIRKILYEQFNIEASHCRVNEFKSRTCAKCTGVISEIWGNLINGPLINIDETDVKTRGSSSSYVWVLTNMESVLYIFKPTRESGFLGELLKGFNGVLVSDFYAGYDSLKCRQQKCLIHLIRDMNSDLLRNQFDVEYKGIVIGFGRLLRSIIETVDKYGLKRWHLKKHLKKVNKLFDIVDKTKYNSEIAIKYQKRFLKYREKLFVFLEFDGIPWNNNNAEHAIKPFAKHRRDLNGRFTERSIRDYLTLLSIEQTCVYREISFLDFLKSDSVSLDQFSRKT